jgi:hypothetical protein
MTLMTSALTMVDGRCAMAVMVRDPIRASRAFCTSPLAGGVEGRGCLVEDGDAGVVQQDQGDGQELLLPAGQPVAALTHHRVVAVGDSMIRSWTYAAYAASPHLLRGGGGTAVPEVGQDAVVEQVALLGHEADGGGQRRLASALASCLRRVMPSFS